MCVWVAHCIPTYSTNTQFWSAHHSFSLNTIPESRLRMAAYFFPRNKAHNCTLFSNEHQPHFKLAKLHLELELRRSACLQYCDHHFNQPGPREVPPQPFKAFLRVLMVARVHQCLKGNLQRPGLFNNCCHNDLCMLLLLVLLQLHCRELALFHNGCRRTAWHSGWLLYTRCPTIGPCCEAQTCHHRGAHGGSNHLFTYSRANTNTNTKLMLNKYM